MILGDDDVLEYNLVTEFCNFLEPNKVEVNLIRFNLRIIDEKGNLQSDYFNYEDHESIEKLLYRIFLMKETITASEFIFSRRIYDFNNGFVDFPLAWFSDYATWLLFSKASGIFNLTNASVYWRLPKKY